MIARVVALVVGALVVAGCGGDETAQPPPPETTSEELCHLVTPSMLETTFGGTFDDGEPSGTDSDFGPKGTPECYYEQSAQDPSDPYGSPIDVRVSVSRNDPMADPLGYYFEQVDYDEVTGLGDLSGFGSRPSGIYDVLLVVTKLDGVDRYLEVMINPLAEPTVEQARPIAERVLDELDA